MKPELLTAKDLPSINRILRRGDQVLLVPTKDGKRGFRIKREEIDFQKLHKIEN